MTDDMIVLSILIPGIIILWIIAGTRGEDKL